MVRRTFLTVGLVVLLGVGAFALTGFLGSRNQSSCCPIRSLFVGDSGDEGGEVVARSAAVDEGSAPKAAAGMINTRCPMMGSKIDPAKVPASLTREFNGRKVGFCCAGCPVAWDKLTDTQKQGKLDALLK